MLTLVSLGAPAVPAGRTDTPDPPLAAAEGFLDLLAAANGLPNATPAEEEGEVADEGDQTADEVEPAEDAVDAALALFLGLPLVPVSVPAPPAGPGQGPSAGDGPQQLGGVIGLPNPALAAPPPFQALPGDPVPNQAQAADNLAPARTTGPVAAPETGPKTAAPPPAPGDLAFSPAAQDDSAAPPETAGSAVESAARFRLDQADGAASTADAALPASLVDPSADTGTPLPVGRETTPTLQAEARPAGPGTAPHRQAAEHLTQLVSQLGGQLTTRHSHSELTLAPEELGRIRFDIRQHGDSLLVTLSADRPETLDLMRRNASDLRSELAAAGLGSATLDFGGSGNPRQTPTEAMAEFEAPSDLPPPAATTAATPMPPQRPVLADGLDLRL